MKIAITAAIFFCTTELAQSDKTRLRGRNLDEFDLWTEEGNEFDVWPDGGTEPPLSFDSPGTSQSFIPLQLGPDGVPPPVSENDIFRGFKLDVADGESNMKDHVFTGDVEDVTFIHSYSYSETILSSEQLFDTMNVGGSLSVSYGPTISGTGAGNFLQENVSSKNQVSFLYRSIFTAYSKKAKVNTIRQDGLSVAGKGTKFIESIIYGAQLDVRYTITSEEEIDARKIGAELEGEVGGLGSLSVEFEGMFNQTEGEKSSRFNMQIESKASGVSFPLPPTLDYKGFGEMNNLISEFNDEYKALFERVGNGETVNQQNVVNGLTPIGISLGDVADYTSDLDRLDSLELDQRLEGLKDVLFHAVEWKGRLDRAKETVIYIYGGHPRDRVIHFETYKNVVEEYEAMSNNQIDA